MQELQIMWERVLSKLEMMTTAVSFDLWIRPLEVLEFKDYDTLILVSSSTMAKNQLLKNHKVQIQNAINEVFSDDIKFEILDQNEKDEYIKNNKTQKTHLQLLMKNILLIISLLERVTSLFMQQQKALQKIQVKDLIHSLFMVVLDLEKLTFFTQLEIIFVMLSQKRKSFMQHAKSLLTTILNLSVQKRIWQTLNLEKNIETLMF